MNIIDRTKKTVEYMIQHGTPTTRVPEEVKQARLEICENCPSKKFVKVTRQCSVCGCFMEIKASLEFDPVKSAKEARRVRSVCPLEHWEEFNSFSSNQL